MMHGPSQYKIVYHQSVIKNDIPGLAQSAKSLIKRAIEERLMIDPIGFGRPLQYSLKGHRRLRVSNYRVVYRIDALNHTVIIIAIKHRKDIYEQF